nr:hypothetical protein [Tanacetum cinerariifolium]
MQGLREEAENQELRARYMGKVKGVKDTICRVLRENGIEKLGSRGIHESLDDKIPNRQRNRNHGDQQRDPLRMPKNQRSAKMYSGREGYASSNPSIQTKQRLEEERDVITNDDHPDQPITIGGNLSAGYRSELIKVLRKHADAFTWTHANMTGIPRIKDRDKNEGEKDACICGLKTGSEPGRRFIRSLRRKDKKYKEKVLEIVRCFDKFHISHIPREQNKKADALIVEEEGMKWMTPIREYIEKGTLTDEPTEARMIREKINNYVIEDGVLYWKSYLGPLLRCIGWVKELSNVLWAHRTMPKTRNKETPFSLAHGTEAVILAEIGMPPRRTTQRTNEENGVKLRLNLNHLKERRDITIIREASGPSQGLHLCRTVIRNCCARMELITLNLICPWTYQLLWSSGDDSGPDLSFNNRIKSKEHDTSSRLGNDAHDDDADIRPIYDEEPMAEAASAKSHHMIASSNSRISSQNMPRFTSNDMVHNHYLEEAKKKTSVVQKKTINPRSCLRWKPTGKIFKTVGLRWVPTRKIFTSSTTKVDSEPLNGSNADITNQYECEQTLDGFKDFSSKEAMTSDHNSSELGLHDHSNEQSSSKLVPDVVPPTCKTATTRQTLELLFHHHITMLRPTCK